VFRLICSESRKKSFLPFPPRKLISILTPTRTAMSTKKTAEAIGIIAGEWVSNAVKYAHPAGVPGRIELASSRCPDGSIEIQVSDDGVGLPDNFDPASKAHEGFRLVQKLADQLGAMLRSDSDELGLCMTLHIPAELAVWIESLSSRKHQGRRL
jgi:two-component sensor histidine kinase